MDYIIIDVREQNEFARSHVKDAINIPVGTIESSSQITNIDKDSNIIVYCQSGNRSKTALNTLNKLGFTNVTNGINQSNVESLIQN